MEAVIAPPKDERAAGLARKGQSMLTPEERSARAAKLGARRQAQLTPEERKALASAAAVARWARREQNPPRPATAPNLPQIQCRRYTLTATAEANGDVVLVGEYLGARPLGQSRQLVVRQRILEGMAPPRVTIDGAGYRASSGREGDRYVVRVDLDDSPADITITRRLPGQLSATAPATWSAHVAYLQHVVDELVLVYSQPLAPRLWEARAWSSNGPMREATDVRILPDGLQTSNRNRTAMLTVPRPRAWQSYAIAWIDRRRGES